MKNPHSKIDYDPSISIPLLSHHRFAALRSSIRLVLPAHLVRELPGGADGAQEADLSEALPRGMVGETIVVIYH
jgi:hypothetical protein